ncbi:hypothetical protein Q8X10_07210 [Pseudomonas aeruginosa]|nr:hypothetical protein [Pseudomonas aeruginosa]MDU0741922.1 hypothetical protein [Pseudomonas aeruginosa]MDU0754491.1 hypothetical protein [Pseudomonas aeruginosa]
MGDPLHRTSQGERNMLGKAEKLSVLVVFELRRVLPHFHGQFEKG